MGCCNNDNADVHCSAHVCENNNFLVRGCVKMLQVYKQFISPLFPPSCRFTPTCSEYAIEAVRKRGLIRGFFLTVYRLLRCHPFARGGYDPVDKTSS